MDEQRDPLLRLHYMTPTVALMQKMSMDLINIVSVTFWCSQTLYIYHSSIVCHGKDGSDLQAEQLALNKNNQTIHELQNLRLMQAVHVPYLLIWLHACLTIKRLSIDMGPPMMHLISNNLSPHTSLPPLLYPKISS